MLEIIFHGRGGQGAVTAANLLVAAALQDGSKGVQAFPLFGAERRGAPVRAFARISDSEIDLRSQVYRPDMVVVLDASLIKLLDITEGLKDNGILVINTTEKPQAFDFSQKFNVATVDATGISVKRNLLVSGIPIVNMPILGAIPRVSELVTLESVTDVIKKQWKGKLGERNAGAAEEAYEATEVNF